MTTTTTNKKTITFLNEWTPQQFKVMDMAIRYHFRDKLLRTLHSNHFLNYEKFSTIDNILGLAYTSTGIWACYGVCNTAAYFDMLNVYQYAYFVMDKESHCYAILQDKDENEIIIPL